MRGGLAGNDISALLFERLFRGVLVREPSLESRCAADTDLFRRLGRGDLAKPEDLRLGSVAHLRSAVSFATMAVLLCVVAFVL